MLYTNIIKSKYKNSHYKGNICSISLILYLCDDGCSLNLYHFMMYKRNLKLWLYIIFDHLNFVPPVYTLKGRGKKSGKKEEQEGKAGKVLSRNWKTESMSKETIDKI